MNYHVGSDCIDRAPNNRFHGPILPIGAEVMALIGVSADFREIRDVREVTVMQDQSICLTLLFDPDQRFDERILREQFQV